MTTTHENDDVLDFPGADRLKAAGEVAPPSPATTQAALHAVRAAMAAEGVAPEGGPRDREQQEAGQQTANPVVVALRSRRSLRRFLVSAAAVAAVAAGAVVYPTVGLGGDKPAATASAADFLHKVARTAADETPAADAPYWKVHWLLGRSGGKSPLSTAWDITTWQGKTGMVTGSKGVWVDFRGKDNGPSWYITPKVGLTWGDIKTLPTDADALRTRLTGSSSPSPSDETSLIDHVGVLLSQAPSSPALRAAVFEMIADTPHVRMAGQVKDSRGRTGTAIDIDFGNNGSKRLVIDPETTLLLEEDDMHVFNHVNTLVARDTYLSQGPARTAPTPTVYYRDLPKFRGPLPPLFAVGLPGNAGMISGRPPLEPPSMR